MKQLLVIFLLFVSIQTLGKEVAEDAYLLGAEDRIVVSVYLEPDLSVATKISQTGHIDFPLLGRVKLAGLTLKSAKAHIEARLRDGYLVKPSVSIAVEQYRPFFIYGEVIRPGSYKYQPGITLEQVIALAGGLKDRASKKEWYILRGINKEKIPGQSDTKIRPGDVIKIEKSFF